MTSWSSGAIRLAWVFALALAAAGSPSAARADTFSNLLLTYSNYDYDTSCTTGCIKEITSLNPLLTTHPDDLALDSTSKLIVVLVESRVIDATQGSPAQAADLRDRLRRLKVDLVADGMIPRLVEASVYGGTVLQTVHQDGKTLLALRRYLRDVKAAYPSMQGVLLVGSFPEAFLVREWGWQPHSNAVTVGGIAYPAGTNWITFTPEIIDERAELVLADLDGNWESIYNEASTPLQNLTGVPVAGSVWPLTAG